MQDGSSHAKSHCRKDSDKDYFPERSWGLLQDHLISMSHPDFQNNEQRADSSNLLGI